MSPEMIQRLILHGGVIPGMVSVLVLGVLWRMHTRAARLPRDEGDRISAGPAWALPLLLAGAFVAADYVGKQSLAWWPRDNTMRAAHAAVLLGVFGAIEGAVRLPGWTMSTIRAVVFGAMAWMLIEGYAPHTISTVDLWGWVIACGVLGSLVAHAADAGTRETPGWCDTLAWLVLIGGAQPMFRYAGFASASLALTGAVSVLSAALLVSLFAPTIGLARGGATVLVGMLIAGVLGAGIQTEPKSVPALLLLAGLPMVMMLRAGGAKTTLLARIVAIGIVLGSVGGLLAAVKAVEPDPYQQYG